MIHQFILAAPKPGMTAQEFQDYWVNVHAVRYAAKIPQIRKYMVDTVVDVEGDLGSPALPHQGIAEIWLANGEEQLASLQTDEFLNGARPDEPNWAAFWLTIVVDTTAHEIVPGPGEGRDRDWVKLTVLMKRRPGLDLDDYRKRSLDGYASEVRGVPGLRRYLHAHTVDGAYVFGEAAFDSVEQLWFDDTEALRQALRSPHFTGRVKAARDEITDPKHVFSLAAKENWIIGPEAR
ncbi:MULTISPECIES: EthD domain-containing protein [unclassified Streptomyces]|uniref:EthD domain-containing protein n=1 Tax=unclassified Streptomyces TaxID=2593676 RepID=UPI000A1F5092|nr:EthD domain-containing protein [Streptomyces sp. 13-12-16]OSP44106.1 ethyl tert-butyl ether degradation protein EthD [Streptomyces sp. 13-12-16]